MASVKRILLGGLVAAGLLLIPAVGGPFVLAGNPCYHGFEIPELTVAAATDIDLEPCAFEPTITVIQPGETVTFRNGPEVAHLVTGANAAWGDRDVEIGASKSIAYTFDEPGVYPYACILHPGMSGAIVVGNGGTALAAAVAASGSGGSSAPVKQGGTSAAASTDAPAVTGTATQPQPLVVIAVALAVAAGLALMVVALAAGSRGTGRKAKVDEPATATTGTPEPLTR